MKLTNLNEIYKSDTGDKLAKEELLPVVRRYVSKKSPKILEIGCGYGRNLVALSAVPGAQVTGCDISQTELAQAQKKLARLKIKNVKLVLQKNTDTLPFENDAFDCVVLWQVLEHVYTKSGKRALLAESARVIKNGGCLVIETPNLLFPFDYHDNNLPLVHWLLPSSARQKITAKIRGYDFPASQYTTVCRIKKYLKQSKGIKKVTASSKIYFENNYLDIFRHLGGTRKAGKLVFFTLYLPLYLLLRLFRLPGDLFTPSIRIAYKIVK